LEGAEARSVSVETVVKEMKETHAHERCAEGSRQKQEVNEVDIESKR
jgi:hypothetical protein